jgi:sulfate adenylyltransferase large subunit
MTAASELEIREDLNKFLDQELNKEMLRFTTAGSVDDGKSTLIGRLLHDCKAVYEDQLASVKKSRINRSGRAIDFSLLTDGLRAEREQGITIDVAYRYFSTPRRKFIIADTPGHEQYTRNMATGASTADLAVILVDASKGLLPQTRRHAYIASLLGISHVVAAINKMDLVDHSEDVFSRLQNDFSALAARLGISAVQCIPISALEGDNLVGRSSNTSWYTGPTLLEHLETVVVQPAKEMGALRFPIQSVIRPDANFRGFAGRVASGVLRPGDAVLALPSAQRTKVDSIVSFDGDLESARAPQSVVVKLADEIDLSRGDILVSPDTQPAASKRFLAMVVWLHAMPLELNRLYLAKHAGRDVKAKATRIRFRVNINTFEEHPASDLEMNEIAAVEFEASQPLFFDPYTRNRTTGSLILIDPLTNATVGAVMIREDLSPERTRVGKDAGISHEAQEGKVTLEHRIQHHGYRPAILSLEGERQGAEELERVLLDRGFETVLVNFTEVPAHSRRILLNTLWSLGLVIISWQETGIRPRDRAFLDSIAGKFHFDLSVAKPPNDSPNDLRRAVKIAETLRVIRAPREGKAN